MRRGAVSIPSNIAEGSSKNSTKEYIQFLYIAQGAASEVETQIIMDKESVISKMSFKYNKS